MLVLTRGSKQQLLIGNGLVTVTVLEVRGGRVRLGIDAAPSVSVRRKELNDCASAAEDPLVISAE